MQPINYKKSCFCAWLWYNQSDKDNQAAVSRATRKGGEAMGIFETLYLLIAFGMFVIALLNAKK
jgi:hypothetical protein